MYANSDSHTVRLGVARFQPIVEVFEKAFRMQ